jgi:ribosomal protein S18 acetylase RimI-like enzyme
MHLVENVSLVNDLVEKYFKKDTWSNNYMLQYEYVNHIQRKKLFYLQQDKNVYFFLDRDGFYRLYYFINEPEKYFTSLEKVPIVLEFLYRGEKYFPKTQQEFWFKSGFKSHLTRDCYFLKNIDTFDYLSNNCITIQIAQTNDEFQFVKKLIDQDLDLYTGDNLSLDEIRNFAKNECIFIAYMDEVPCGFLQAELKNNTFWLGHIVVDSKFRGKGIAKALVNHYINKGRIRKCNQFQLWVIQDNYLAVDLYKKSGFKYLNKSSYSMLRK